MKNYIKDLYLLRRDIVSEGFNQALEYIKEIIPIKTVKVRSGKKCWTWKIPEKWTVYDAWIKDISGKKILDLKDHPLQVISYSLPVDKEVSHKELMDHLHYSDKRPNAVKFEFKYYERDWGFCTRKKDLKKFKSKKYHVHIDSKFEKDYLKIGELTIPGKKKNIVVLAAHLCHPAMANDDLSGCAVAIDIAKELMKRKNNYTYKILFLPETIGSVAYLSKKQYLIKKMKYGIFLEMLGNKNIHNLQFSKERNTKIDRIAEYVLKKSKKKFRSGDFREVVRNDEMVFDGPGVNIPMISLSRWPYPEYHTSDDNPSIIHENMLKESKDTVMEILNILDADYTPKRRFRGPVFLSGYNLWVDWRKDWDLNQNIDKIMLRLEGKKSIFYIAEELNMDFKTVLDYVNKMKKKKLIIRS